MNAERAVQRRRCTDLLGQRVFEDLLVAHGPQAEKDEVVDADQPVLVSQLDSPPARGAFVLGADVLELGPVLGAQAFQVAVVKRLVAMANHLVGTALVQRSLRRAGGVAV
jgi:hypothetical protein